jgi:hypothetical protein
VEKTGPFRDPPAGHLLRILAVKRFFSVIALEKADAFSAADIDGRDDQHRKRLKEIFTAELAESAEKEF